MYTIDSYQNNLILLPFLWRLLHFKHFSGQMSGGNLSYYPSNVSLYMSLLIYFCPLYVSLSCTLSLHMSRSVTLSICTLFMSLSPAFMYLCLLFARSLCNPVPLSVRLSVSQSVNFYDSLSLSFLYICPYLPYA